MRGNRLWRRTDDALCAQQHRQRDDRQLARGAIGHLDAFGHAFGFGALDQVPDQVGHQCRDQQQRLKVQGLARAADLGPHADGQQLGVAKGRLHLHTACVQRHDLVRSPVA